MAVESIQNKALHHWRPVFRTLALKRRTAVPGTAYACQCAYTALNGACARPFGGLGGRWQCGRARRYRWEMQQLESLIWL